MFTFSLQKSLFTFAFFALMTTTSYASKSIEEKTETYNPVPSIMHHISDSHEWHFWGEGENSFTIALPIILYTNTLHVFMSSEFHHNEDGHHVVENKGNKFVNFHGKIYLLNNGELTAQFDEHHQIHQSSLSHHLHRVCHHQCPNIPVPRLGLLGVCLQGEVQLSVAEAPLSQYCFCT